MAVVEAAAAEVAGVVEVAVEDAAGAVGGAVGGEDVGVGNVPHAGGESGVVSPSVSPSRGQGVRNLWTA